MWRLVTGRPGCGVGGGLRLEPSAPPPGRTAPAETGPRNTQPRGLLPADVDRRPRATDAAARADLGLTAVQANAGCRLDALFEPKRAHGRNRTPSSVASEAQAQSQSDSTRPQSGGRPGPAQRPLQRRALRSDCSYLATRSTRARTRVQPDRRFSVRLWPYRERTRPLRMSKPPSEPKRCQASNRSQNALNRRAGSPKLANQVQTPNLVWSQTDELRVYDRPNQVREFRARQRLPGISRRVRGSAPTETAGRSEGLACGRRRARRRLGRADTAAREIVLDEQQVARRRAVDDREE